MTSWQHFVLCVHHPKMCVLLPQEALEIVADYPDNLQEGRNQLVQAARERWAAIQGGRTCDDITAVVVKLHCNKQSC